MANQNESLPIPTFAGDHYDQWCVKMKTIFKSQDLWEYVDDGYEELEASTSDLNAQQLKTLKEHRRKDAKALSYIQQGVSPDIFSRIMGANKAKEAWEILQKEFQGNLKVKNVTLQTLRRELENLRMSDGESIQDYYTKITKIVNEMKTFGEVISDDRIVEKVLVSLPPKFDPMVSIIEETKDISSLGVQELMGSLKAHERRIARHEEKSIESAFQSKMNVNQEGHGGRHARGRGRGRRSRGRGRSNFQRTSNAENSQSCNICGKNNHMEKDCWHKDKPQCYYCKKFGHLEKNCRLKNNQQAHVSEEKKEGGNLFYACHMATKAKDEVWYLDSGCSNHMTRNKSIFVDLDD